MEWWACALLLIVAALPAAAEYPTPEQAGFHHCALIYEAPTRTEDDLAPYAANATGWMFDAFLFLHQTSACGKNTTTGMMTKADWASDLDLWFSPGRDLHTLDAALEKAAARLGPVAPRQVIIMIPYPNPAMTDFGDADGDGASESLGEREGQLKAARWYMAEVERRFREAGFRHLALWGLYWMNEGASDADVALARPFSQATHEARKKLLWIPWYKATNYERWREMGVDVAIMQPNYAFLSIHFGAVRRNRLAATADAAARSGMGVEIEFPMAWWIPGDPTMLRHYLRDGAADRYRYQQAATAYYMNVDSLERFARSANPRERSLYDDVAAYVQNRPVLEPDAAVEWQAGGQPAPWLGDHRLTEGQPVPEAQALVPRQRYDALDVFLYEPQSHWTGLVTVESGGEGAWRPAGWALRTAADPDDGPWQAVTVPLRAECQALRVRFVGQGQPCVAELTPVLPQLGQIEHLALGCPYAIMPETPATYGDAGGELTDGVVPEAGFPSGQTVGWFDKLVSVSFDLGRVVNVSGAAAFMQGGGVGGVSWPRSATVALSTNVPVVEPTGVGEPPQDLLRLSPEPLAIDRRRAADNCDGRLEFLLPRPAPARFVTFVFEPHNWLMLSELDVYDGDRNLVAGSGYHLKPVPSRPASTDVYSDDRRRLTDGLANPYEWLMESGWNDGQERTVYVDLGRLCRLDEVAVWTMTGADRAVFPFASASVALSRDRQRWQAVGEGMPEPAPATPSTATPCRISAGGAMGRYVRVVVKPGRGWSMLTEIEVRGKPAE